VQRRLIYTAQTVSLLLAWQLAMLHYPEVQRRAQMEVDALCGRSRLPDFNDRPLMPYVEAVLLETMRWHAIVPLSEC
jgi:cytochrome P450